MGCAVGTVRYILFFFNFLLALAGLGILILSVMTVTSKEGSFIHGQLSTPAIVFAIIGGCVFIFAFFGCCGALRESHCMIVTYAVLLLTLFLLQVAVAVLSYTYKSQTENAATQGLTSVFEDYNNSTKDKSFVDNLQKELHCCGSVDTNSPWNTLNMSPPSSCYDSNNPPTKYNEACIPKLVNLVESALSSIGEVAIAVGVVEVVGIIFSLCLANSIRRSELRGYA